MNSSLSFPSSVPSEVRVSGDKPALTVSNLTVKAGSDKKSCTLVDNISFDVYPGETLCVVGESGSGKSVTSLAIMGLLPKGILTVTSGSIRVAGEDVLRATQSRLRALRASCMAMVFQEPMTALNPVQRVGDQVEEVLRVHRHMTAKERRKQVLDMLKSTHLADVERIYSSYPHQLSGGQRQRIVIAMALILQPTVLIADEPTTAVDVTTQKQILTVLRELQQRQHTAVVFITHDFGVVADIADRIVVMNRGRLVEAGTRDDILARPEQEYTRMLVSSVPSLTPSNRPSPVGKKVLELTGLGKTYYEKPMFGKSRLVSAARNIELSIRRGEITGIVGESGSGKSTVARCVVRLIDPSSGAIRINNIDITNISSSKLRLFRRHMQIVFQDPYRSLNPRRTVGDSLVEGLVNFGCARTDAQLKVAEALVLVGLDSSVIHRYPHQFSGGQRQRLCIARAVVMEPDLLVADEAVSALDVSVQAQVLELLEKIRERTGVAILFITHDLRVAAQICDTIVVMQQGRIIESGSAASVLTAPREEYTKALINAAPGRNWDFRNFRPIKAV